MTAIRSFEADGDHFAIGCALGKHAAHALNHVLPNVERFRALERRWGDSEYIAALEAAGRAAFPQYMREIEGIAEGAGVPFSQVFLWNCRGDVPGGGDHGPEPEAAGCTTFLLPGNPPVIGHNEDGEPEEDGQCFVVTLTPDDGPALTSFYIPGLLPGHSFGCNHAGLVQAINHIRPFDQRPGIPRHLIARAVLGSRNLDEALAILRRTDRASGFHHNLGFAGDHRLLSVEAPASGCEFLEASEPHCHANHLIRDAFSTVRQDLAPSSTTRQSLGEALLRQIPRPGATALLGDTSTAPLPIYRKALTGEDPNFTLATGIFSIHKDALDWQIYHRLEDGPTCQGRIATSP